MTESQPLTPADFIARWKDSGGGEIANSQSFLKELCQLLSVPEPEPVVLDHTSPVTANQRARS